MLQILCFRPECTILGYEVGKKVSHNSIHSTPLKPKCCLGVFQSNSQTFGKMMFGSVSEQFANLRHVTRCKSCVSNLKALFRGTEVAKMVSQQKRPFYSITAKMMFWSVSKQFANVLNVKRCKTCVFDLIARFRDTEVGKMVSAQ